MTRLHQLAISATPGSDAQLQLVTACTTYARLDQDVAWMRGLLEGTAILEGLAIDTEMRWTLLTSLATAGAATEREIEAERQNDNTSTGRERAARALAGIPTAEAKDKAWQLVIEQDGLPNQMVDAIAQASPGSRHIVADVIYREVPRHADHPVGLTHPRHRDLHRLRLLSHALGEP